MDNAYGERPLYDHPSDQANAAVFAAQTAIIATLANELIKAKAIQRKSLVVSLYDLLRTHGAERQPAIGAAPIKHLISLLEK